MNQNTYDLLVIGTGPAGQKAAIQAAKLNKKIAVVERKAVVGGVSVNIGTIPSKTLREAAVYLSGHRLHNVYGASYAVKQKITIEDLLFRTNHVIRNEIDVTKHQLIRNNIDIFTAKASFTDPHTLKLDFIDGSGSKKISAEKIIIAVGTKTTKDSHIPFDSKNIFSSDDIFNLDEIPQTMTVVGAGVIGLEYASIFAALGVRVTIIDRRTRLLSFVDSQIIDTMIYHLRQKRAIFHLGEEVKTIEKLTDAKESVRLHLGSGKKILAEKVLCSIGRTGNTDDLNLPAAGLTTADRQLLKVNGNYQTAVPHIYAAGDVIGFPSLASTSMEQGRLATCHAFDAPAKSVPELIPYGIYSVPEISTVGRNEEELTAENIPYEVGEAQYREIARGQIIGDDTGMLKLIFHIETKRLLGVHIIGEGASELIHIGQAVMAFNGTVDYFVNTVFNYPTLAECYKTAALDGINRLGTF